MINAQKYKTLEERMDAFGAFCEKQQPCKKCLMVSRRCVWLECAFRWLDLEAEEEKPLPCPFCGNKHPALLCMTGSEWNVDCGFCGAHIRRYSREDAIAAWNRRVK